MPEVNTDYALRIDLDSTLFRTGDFFYGGVLNLLERRFGVDQQAFREKIPAFNKDTGTSRNMYDFFGQLEATNLDSDAVEAAIIEELSTDDNLYPGATDFLKRIAFPLEDTSILTLGEHRFQVMKYKCAPMLGGLSIETMVGPKGPHLQQSLAGKPGIIVDDREIDDLPANVIQARIIHSDDAQPHIYNSFDQLLKNWPHIVDKLTLV